MKNSEDKKKYFEGEFASNKTFKVYQFYLRAYNVNEAFIKLEEHLANNIHLYGDVDASTVTIIPIEAKDYNIHISYIRL